MKPCAFCGQPVVTEAPGVHYEVTSWVTGPKRDGAVLREETGRVAHSICVDKLKHGQAVDQPELFPEEN